MTGFRHPITRMRGWRIYRDLLVVCAAKEFARSHNIDHFPDARIFHRALRDFVVDMVEHQTGFRPRVTYKELSLGLVLVN